MNDGTKVAFFLFSSTAKGKTKRVTFLWVLVECFYLVLSIPYFATKMFVQFLRPESTQSSIA